MRVLVRAIIYFGDVLSTALFVRALMSWFVRGGSGVLGKVYRILYRITEPIVAPCRKLMNRYFNTGMFDFSVFVAMILIELVTRVLVRFLWIFV